MYVTVGTIARTDVEAMSRLNLKIGVVVESVLNQSCSIRSQTNVGSISASKLSTTIHG